MVAASSGFVLLMVTASMVFWPELALSSERAVQAAFSLLVFWIMAVGNVLLFTMRWNREDILLEQKRTQLEVALLREGLAGPTIGRSSADNGARG